MHRKADVGKNRKSLLHVASVGQCLVYFAQNAAGQAGQIKTRKKIKYNTITHAQTDTQNYKHTHAYAMVYADDTQLAKVQNKNKTKNKQRNADAGRSR